MIIFYPSIEKSLEAVLTGQEGCTTLNELCANEILRTTFTNRGLHQQLGLTVMRLDVLIGLFTNVKIGNLTLTKK